MYSRDNVFIYVKKWIFNWKINRSNDQLDAAIYCWLQIFFFALIEFFADFFIQKWNNFDLFVKLGKWTENYGYGWSWWFVGSKYWASVAYTRKKLSQIYAKYNNGWCNILDFLLRILRAIRLFHIYKLNSHHW